MKYCHYLFVALGITSAAILASCQDEDFGYTADQIAYRTNFEKMYGSVKDIPTWDFSSYNLRQMGLAGGPSYAGTRGLASNYTGTVNTIGATAGDILKTSAPTGVTLTDGWYSVPSATLSWLDNSLPEATEYKQGKSFVLGKPQDNFAIIPIYQGHAGMSWELHLVDKATNKDYTLWEKSEKLRYNVDFDANNAIDVARREIIDWDEVWIDANGDGENDTNTGKQEKLIPIGYLLKAWEPSFGDLVLSCDVPDGCVFNGRIVDNSAEGQGKVIDLKKDGSAIEFTHSGNETFTIPSSVLTEIKNQNLADNIYFELWWNDGWKEGGKKCYFGYYEDNKATFHITTASKSSGTHIGKVYLSGRVSNEVGHTVGKATAGVEAQPILIDGTKILGDMYLYLKITQLDEDNPGYAKEGACQRSDENMMVALPIAESGKPTNVGSNEYMIIGCEDANNTNKTPGKNDLSDWDYNDIVFLLVGQGELPKIKEVIAEKRYMIEDLGSTFDFDFNDIVVDVSQIRVTDYKGDAVGGNDGKTTTAVIRHLCGTIPFQIKIGNTTFDKLPGKVNCNPAQDSEYTGKYEKTVDGWNPNSNNITVTVWPNEAGDNTWKDEGNNGFVGKYPEDSKSFSFPSFGEFPYIIACDQNVNWMEENISVPDNWFKTWPKQYYDYNNQTPPTPTDPDDPASPQRVPITLQDGKFILSNLSSAQATDKVEFELQYDRTKDSNGINSDWGIGCFANDNWEIVGTEWKYGGPENWTHEVSVETIRSLAATLEQDYIMVNTYNGCSIVSVTLVKQ